MINVKSHKTFMLQPQEPLQKSCKGKSSDKADVLFGFCFRWHQPQGLQNGHFAEFCLTGIRIVTPRLTLVTCF